MAGNWQEHEVRELLLVRGEQEIRRQMDGTCRSATVYSRVEEMLRERGVERSKKQIISKLKTLKKQYMACVDHNGRSGRDRKTMPFFMLCEAIWGNRPGTRPVAISSSIAIIETPATRPGPSYHHIQESRPSPAPAPGPSSASSTSSSCWIEENPDPDSETATRANTSREDADTTDDDVVVEIVAENNERQAEVEPQAEPLAQPEAFEDEDDGDARQQGERPRKKQRRKTKMEQAANAFGTLVSDQLTALADRHDASEERRSAEQRQWEERVQREAQAAQLNVVREMRAAQNEFMEQLLRFAAPQQAVPHVPPPSIQPGPHPSMYQNHYGWYNSPGAGPSTSQDDGSQDGSYQNL